MTEFKIVREGHEPRYLEADGFNVLPDSTYVFWRHNAPDSRSSVGNRSTIAAYTKVEAVEPVEYDEPDE